MLVPYSYLVIFDQLHHQRAVGHRKQLRILRKMNRRQHED